MREAVRLPWGVMREAVRLPGGGHSWPRARGSGGAWGRRGGASHRGSDSPPNPNYSY